MSNNGIQVIIPLDMFPEDTDMTVEGLLRTLGDAQTARAAANHYKELYNALAQQMQSAGNSLQLILDEVDGEWERVQALRRFAEEMKEAGARARQMP